MWALSLNRGRTEAGSKRYDNIQQSWSQIWSSVREYQRCGQLDHHFRMVRQGLIMTRKSLVSQTCYLTPVILATWETEKGRITSRGQPRQIVHETPHQLLCKYEVLSSNPSPTLPPQKSYWWLGVSLDSYHKMSSSNLVLPGLKVACKMTA
jgi:hypothetical protein